MKERRGIRCENRGKMYEDMPVRARRGQEVGRGRHGHGRWWLLITFLTNLLCTGEEFKDRRFWTIPCSVMI